MARAGRTASAGQRREDGRVLSENTLPAEQIRAAQLPSAGIGRELIADESQRAAIARFAGLSSIESFKGSFQVAPTSGNGAIVTGQIDAEITQPCVVTLEPVHEHLSVPVERRFLLEAPQNGDIHDELLADVFEEDPPESYDGLIDLWQIAIEALVLNFNPFPRADDADEFLADATGEDEAPTADSPFSALTALKKKGDKFQD
jgi:uncharacterized metal-binding protein YceD (DUF177 family)